MPQISTLELTQDFGRFVLEPLERGYGQTIGNALRRVLLGSIQGAAVAAIKVANVAHEFAPIPGVKEDVTELLLNLKNLAIKVDTEGGLPTEDKILKIEVKGPGRVTGADVECPAGVTIANPEVYIATISDAKTPLSLELYVGWGSGYVLPEKQERYRGIIGVLPTGSQYTPVVKVNYIVEQTRVGMRTDYERLVLEITTNGSVTPNDALSQASNILVKYFQMFREIGASGFEADFDVMEDMLPELANIPEIRIEEMDFSQRTFNCLRRAGLMSLRALATANESDLTSIRGFGKKSLLEVRDKLQEHGLELKPPKGGYRALDTLDDEDDDF